MNCSALPLGCHTSRPWCVYSPALIFPRETGEYPQSSCACLFSSLSRFSAAADPRREPRRRASRFCSGLNDGTGPCHRLRGSWRHRERGQRPARRPRAGRARRGQRHAHRQRRANSPSTTFQPANISSPCRNPATPVLAEAARHGRHCGALLHGWPSHANRAATPHSGWP